jgi:hypothetical protein
MKRTKMVAYKFKRRGVSFRDALPPDKWDMMEQFLMMCAKSTPEQVGKIPQAFRCYVNGYCWQQPLIRGKKRVKRGGKNVQTNL